MNQLGCAHTCVHTHLFLEPIPPSAKRSLGLDETGWPAAEKRRHGRDPGSRVLARRGESQNCLLSFLIRPDFHHTCERSSMQRRGASPKQREAQGSAALPRPRELVPRTSQRLTVGALHQRRGRPPHAPLGLLVRDEAGVVAHV